jgi:WD40-like Beta Propeller Repeat
MAAFSPDGKWIVFAEFAGSPSHAIGIFSVPSSGGKPRQLHTTGPVDEFHCSTSSTGSCVIRVTNGKKEFVFYALDPVQGVQQEVGRIPWEPTVLGDWSISPDGSTVAMANHDPENPGIQLIHLSPHRSIPPSTIPVLGFGEVREATWLPDAKGFFVETKTMTGYNLRQTPASEPYRNLGRPFARRQKIGLSQLDRRQQCLGRPHVASVGITMKWRGHSIVTAQGHHRSLPASSR